MQAVTALILRLRPAGPVVLRWQAGGQDQDDAPATGVAVHSGGQQRAAEADREGLTGRVAFGVLPEATVDPPPWQSPREVRGCLMTSYIFCLRYDVDADNWDVCKETGLLGVRTSPSGCRTALSSGLSRRRSC